MPTVLCPAFETGTYFILKSGPVRLHPLQHAKVCFGVGSKQCAGNDRCCKDPLALSIDSFENHNYHCDVVLVCFQPQNVRQSYSGPYNDVMFSKGTNIQYCCKSRERNSEALNWETHQVPWTAKTELTFEAYADSRFRISFLNHFFFVSLFFLPVLIF